MEIHSQGLISAIHNAYNDGYSQVDIALHLKVSKSLISKVVKSGDSLTGVNKQG